MHLVLKVLHHNVIILWILKLVYVGETGPSGSPGMPGPPGIQGIAPFYCILVTISI